MEPKILNSEKEFKVFNELPCPTNFKYEYSVLLFAAGKSNTWISPEKLQEAVLLYMDSQVRLSLETKISKYDSYFCPGKKPISK